MNLDWVPLSSGEIVRPFSLKGDNILCITSAIVADNAESPNYEWLGHSHEAILSINIYFSNNGYNWKLLHWIPLPGMHYTGDEGSGTYRGYPKLEWLDCECMDYQNLGILDWDLFPYEYIRFQIKEGDKVKADDILLDVWGNAEYYKNSRDVHEIWGNNYHHAAISIQTVDHNN